MNTHFEYKNLSMFEKCWKKQEDKTLPAALWWLCIVTECMVQEEDHKWLVVFIQGCSITKTDNTEPYQLYIYETEWIHSNCSDKLSCHTLWNSTLLFCATALGFLNKAEHQCRDEVRVFHDLEAVYWGGKQQSSQSAVSSDYHSEKWRWAP